MSDYFSSEDAGKATISDCDTLEEAIFEVDRDHDEESSKHMRFRDWQEAQLRIIKSNIGTNATEVVAKSYLFGLRRLREKTKQDVDDLQDMLVNFLMVVGNSEYNEREIEELHREVMNYTVDYEKNESGDLAEPRRYKVKESALSEVEDTYAQDAFFGGWIHRYVAALGFLDSQYLTDYSEQQLGAFTSDMAGSLKEAREEVEGMIMDYIGVSMMYWKVDGIDRGTYEGLSEIVEKMETERKEYCEAALEELEVLSQQNTEDDNGRNRQDTPES